ncbi:hypothetical protein ACFTVM_39115, partial [Nocardia sp. NPDC057030]
MARRSLELNNPTTRRGMRPIAGALPLAIAVACAGVAVADPGTPTQPGVTTPSAPAAPERSPSQPGVTTPNQQGVTGPKPAPADPADTQTLNYARPMPAPEPAPPIQPQQLHVPQPVEPVAPIAPPPRTLRIGDFSAPAPNEVPGELLDGVNDAAAGVEAAIATGGRSIGINPT